MAGWLGILVSLVLRHSLLFWKCPKACARHVLSIRCGYRYVVILDTPA